jgi:hypothetical protein
MDEIIGLLIRFFVVVSVVRSLNKTFNKVSTELPKKEDSIRKQLDDAVRPFLDPLQTTTQGQPQVRRASRAPKKPVKPPVSTVPSDIGYRPIDLKSEEAKFLEEGESLEWQDYDEEVFFSEDEPMEQHEGISLRPEELLTGIVLAEILGPPKCRRSRNIMRWNA